MEHDELDHLEDNRDNAVTFLLPQWNHTLGFSCAKEWCQTARSHQCGCPNCLGKIGLTLIFHIEDFNKDAELHSMCRRVIVSQKTARCVTHLICKNYPGAKA